MLECRILTSDLSISLAQFFEELGAQPYFHPHPFTKDEAYKKCGYVGKDLYYALVDSSCIIGYGMLRGWDEGYQVPSLGIVIHPKHQGKGLGKLLMSFLHAAAKQYGANNIILKVYPENTSALKLYEFLGYSFERIDGQRQLSGRICI